MVSFNRTSSAELVLKFHETRQCGALKLAIVKTSPESFAPFTRERQQYSSTTRKTGQPGHPRHCSTGKHVAMANTTTKKSTTSSAVDSIERRMTLFPLKQHSLYCSCAWKSKVQNHECEHVLPVVSMSLTQCPSGGTQKNHSRPSIDGPL